jgi:zinc/manganese transport system substrate-binding protein
MTIVPTLRAAGRGRRPGAFLLVVLALAVGGCSSSTSTSGSTGGRATITAVAAEDFWGSILRQLAGDSAKVTSIIGDPNVDPHSYDATSSDGVKLAEAKLVVVNGVGYDAWADKLLAANPAAGRIVLNVGNLVGAREGDNPHRWYSPPDVAKVVDEMTADLKKADPGNAASFDQRRAQLVTTGFKAYDDLRADIRARFAGTPVGISESIFSPLANDLGLAVVTPPRFADAIAEGNEPTAGDKQTVDRQIAEHQVKVLVYNAQNATPDVKALVDRARATGIPVATVTETLTPRGATFQDWQVAQLTQLRAALAAATGR